MNVRCSWFFGLALMFVLAITSGCVNIVRPSRNVLPVLPEPQNESNIAGTVSVNLSAVSSALKSLAPTKLVSSTDTINVSANITTQVATKVMVDVPRQVVKQVTNMVSTPVQSVCNKLGIFGKVLFTFACTVNKVIPVVQNVTDTVIDHVEQTVNKATDIKTPIQVALVTDVDLTDVRVTAYGSRLQVDAVADFSLEAKTGIDVVKVGVAQCGVGETRPEVTLSLPIDISWGTDGKLQLAKAPWTLNWNRPCNLTFLNVSLEELLKISGLESKLDGLIDEKLAAVPIQFDVSKDFDVIWSEVEQVRGLSDQVWLVPNPQEVNVSNPVGDGGNLSITIGVHCHPYIVYGQKPDLLPTPRPAFAHESGPNTFNIDLDGRVDYHDAETLLNTHLAGKEISLSGHQVRITNFEVYGSGSTLVVGVGVSKPFRARLWLFGHPTFNSATNEVSVEDLDYTAETSNVLVKIADWILHSELRERIRQEAIFPTNSQFVQARKILEDYKTNEKGVQIEIKVSTLRGENLFLADDYIGVRVEIYGTATAIINDILKLPKV